MTEPCRPSILVVEDDPLLAEIYLQYLDAEPVETEHVATGRAALERIGTAAPAILLLDLGLPDMDGQEILKHIKQSGMPTTAVIITGNGSIDTAVKAMRAGAYDFLVKPFNRARLSITIKNALEHQRLENLVETYKRDFDRDSFQGFIGASLPMQAVYRVVESAAPSKATVFITGESGTGKEVCAQAIHQTSPRRGKPFIALNCGAIPSELMESEMFGHAKGAFTGAIAARDGAAKLADSGTLFLDEICDMDLALQAKLLRFVQTGIVQPVGSDEVKKVDVRLICATNRIPIEEVEAERFREDLYYRLHVIPVDLPPLRERDLDILPLAGHFLHDFAKEEGKAFKHFSPEVEAILQCYNWPGNVRQLQNVVRNIAVLHDGEEVTQDMLPTPLHELATHLGADDTGLAAKWSRKVRNATPGTADADDSDDAIRPLWMVERDVIEEAIAQCGGSIVKAATLLGIDGSTIYRKRRRWKDLPGDSPSL